MQEDVIITNPYKVELMKKIFTTGMALALILVAHTCKQIREGAESTSERQPLIEITPLEQGRGQWKIAITDAVAVVVTAPGAERIQILGRLEGVEEDYLEASERSRRRLIAQAEEFVTRLNLAPDFAGRRVGGGCLTADRREETDRNNRAHRSGPQAPESSPRPDAVGGSVGTDESARSDKLTGGQNSALP